MYKAKNIDTDKALQAIEAYRLRKEYDYDRDLYGLKKYYAYEAWKRERKRS